ncbi:hypothetical protein L208DRAFT_1306687, partial [Tricholoma matsutake]
IQKIVAPYLERLRQRKGLKKIEGLLIIDVWSVHRGEPFHMWMKTEYRWIKIVFIPGGCTGKFQPNDVGIQQIIKHIFAHESVQYFVVETKSQLATRPNTAVKLNVDLGQLRNATVGWALKAYQFLKDHPEIVRKVNILLNKEKNWADSIMADD